MSKVGFVGLGIMGTPMAGHLLAAGHELFVYDLRQPAQSLIDQGAKLCASGKEVAQHSDIVIVMVPDTPACRGGAVRPRRHRGRARQRKDRCRHELDLAGRDQGLCADAGLSRRARFRWRGRSEAASLSDFLGRIPMRAVVGTGASGAALLQIQQAVPIQQTDGKALPCDARDLANCAAGVVDKAKAVTETTRSKLRSANRNDSAAPRQYRSEVIGYGWRGVSGSMVMSGGMPSSHGRPSASR